MYKISRGCSKGSMLVPLDLRLKSSIITTEMEKYIQSRTLFIKIANCNIKINFTNNTNIMLFLLDFVVPPFRKYHFLIEFKNKIISNKKGYNNNKIFLHEKINMYAFQYFLRNIIQSFFGKRKNGFFLHCSGVSINNNAYLFLGPHGAGKSTISQMLSDIVPVLADDAGLVVEEGNKFYFFQTPFIEKSYFKKSPNKFNIERVFFLKKSNSCCVVKITDKNRVLDLFLKQLWTDKKLLNIQLSILMKFVNSFNQFYLLNFPKNKKAVINWFINYTELSTSNYAQEHPQQNNCDIPL